MLVHSVYFYFKPEATEEQKANCRKMAEGLGRIETVKSIYVGAPAPVPARDVLVKDFDLCLTEVFESVEGHDVYQEHPIHLEFVEANKSFWAKVQIYDSM